MLSVPGTLKARGTPLRLVPAKDQTDVLVIDHVEEPSPD